MRAGQTYKRIAQIKSRLELQKANAKRAIDREKSRKESHEYELGPDAYDKKAKMGAVAAPGSGTIAKAKKAKASDVNKSLEQQMKDAMKEHFNLSDEDVKRMQPKKKVKKESDGKLFE